MNSDTKYVTNLSTDNDFSGGIQVAHEPNPFLPMLLPPHPLYLPFQSFRLVISKAGIEIIERWILPIAS